MAKNDTFEPLDIELDNRDRDRCATAVGLYCKKLESLEVGAEKIHRREAAQFHKDAEALRVELQQPLEDGGAKILPHHLPVIKEGLEILVQNTRAAKGTMTGIGKTDVVDELDKDASYIEATLIPKFDEQRSLDLPGKKPDPTLTNERGETLADIARREAEEAEKPRKARKSTKKQAPLKVEK